MWRWICCAVLALALLSIPSSALIAVSPFTETPSEVPTYERHVGSDESLFRSLSQRLADEESRRRADDQETRGRLAEHDRLIGSLTADARIVATRVSRIEDLLFWVIGLLLSIFAAQLINSIFTRRIDRAIRGPK